MSDVPLFLAGSCPRYKRPSENSGGLLFPGNRFSSGFKDTRLIWHTWFCWSPSSSIRARESSRSRIWAIAAEKLPNYAIDILIDDFYIYVSNIIWLIVPMTLRKMLRKDFMLSLPGSQNHIWSPPLSKRSRHPLTLPKSKTTK